MDLFEKLKTTAASIIIDKKPKDKIGKTLKDFLKNIWGSDTTTPYTAEYTWLANQVAHATLGFLLGCIWILIGRNFFTINGWQYLILSVSLIKEIIDFLMDLLNRVNSFKLNKREIILDCLTDFLFATFGALLSFSFFLNNQVKWLNIILVLAIGLPLILFATFKIWLPRMRMFDFSQMPFNNCRLIKYENVSSIFEQADIDKINKLQNDIAFIKQNNSSFPDIILSGNNAITKSKLAISIGCEFISYWKGAYCISMAKLLEKQEIFFDIIQHNQSPKKFFIKAFILDDINVNLPIPTFIVNSENKIIITPLNEISSQEEKASNSFFEKFIETHNLHPEICFIWVLSGQSKERFKLWIEFIKHFSESDFIEINIKNNI